MFYIILTLIKIIAITETVTNVMMLFLLGKVKITTDVISIGMKNNDRGSNDHKEHEMIKFNLILIFFSMAKWQNTRAYKRMCSTSHLRSFGVIPIPLGAAFQCRDQANFPSLTRVCMAATLSVGSRPSLLQLLCVCNHSPRN